MHDTHDTGAKPSRRELDEIMKRVREEVPPPKMVVIRQGWFREKVRRASLEDLQREDHERAAQG